MLRSSTFAGPLSGSVGGLTASHNRGGQYFRARTIPTNPASPQQSIVRGYFATLSSLWSSLSLAVVGDWTSYALLRPTTNAIGDTISLPPLTVFQQVNMARLQAGLPIVTSPPIVPADDILTPADGTGAGSFVEAAAGSPGTLDLLFQDTDAWANEDDAALLFFVGRVQRQAINFYSRGYRLAGKVLGDATTAPTSPVTVNSPFLDSYVAGNKVWWKLYSTRADGQRSAVLTGVATAA